MIVYTGAYTDTINNKYDDNISDNNIQKIIIKLPDDIKNKIYKEYLEPIIYYNLYIDTLEYSGKRYIYIYLSKLLPYIFAKKNVKNYIINKCIGFNTSYEKHKINNTKSFIKLTKGESFALSVIYSYYH